MGLWRKMSANLSVYSTNLRSSRLFGNETLLSVES